jgi:ABC-type transport system involved in multi-copper enzyme maturation permease subunit
MRNILMRLWLRNRAFLLACAGMLGLFQFLMCALVAELDIENALEQVIAFLPPVMRSVIEQTMLGGSSAGVLAFGWNHPIVLALAAAVAIALAARAVAGEVEGGAIELVLAQPLRRSAFLAAQVVFGVMGIGLLAATGIAGTILGQRVFELVPFGTDRLLRLLLNFALLQTAIFGVTLLASAHGREAGRAAIIGVLVTVASYFLGAFATWWPKLAPLGPYSLHTYYDPRAILVGGELSQLALVVLSACSVLTILLAFQGFGRRDLP